MRSHVRRAELMGLAIEETRDDRTIPSAEIMLKIGMQADVLCS